MNGERSRIEQNLEEILRSPDFAAAPKMQALLRYIVEATLNGQGERLKGYTIGVDVFDRPASFDPGADSIVRVQVGRLRSLLEKYYRGEGRAAGVRIVIPKGGYEASFQTAQSAPAEAPGDGGWRTWLRAPLAWVGAHPRFSGALAIAALAAAFALWAPVARPHIAAAANGPITLAILPFDDISAADAHSPVADALTENLTTAMARVRALSLTSRTAAAHFSEEGDLRRIGRDLNARYLLEGSVQPAGEALRINVQLIDSQSGAHLWAGRYDRAGADALAREDDVVALIASELRVQIMSAARPELAARAARGDDPWALYLSATWSPGAAQSGLAWEEERVALARRALALDPHFGQAHSVLADKLAYLANVDPAWDTPQNRDEAAMHAQRALDFASDDADAMFNVSIYDWHAGRIADSVSATHRTLDLNPNHSLARFLVDVVPYTCARAPDAVIAQLAARDAAMSPDNPVRWVTLTWLNALYLNNGDFARAAEAGQQAQQIFVTPDTLFRYAATLVALGRADEARDALERQRLNWPRLDARHYADVTIPRRCGEAEGAARLHALYDHLADMLE